MPDGCKEEGHHARIRSSFVPKQIREAPNTVSEADLSLDVLGERVENDSGRVSIRIKPSSRSAERL
jgi:hypothetical protein